MDELKAQADQRRPHDLDIRAAVDELMEDGAKLSDIFDWLLLNTDLTPPHIGMLLNCRELVADLWKAERARLERLNGQLWFSQLLHKKTRGCLKTWGYVPAHLLEPAFEIELHRVNS